MSTPLKLFVTLYLFTVCCVAEARIGENKGTLESRLLSRESNAIKIGNKELYAHYMKTFPLNNELSSIEDDIEIVVYYKNAQGQKPIVSKLFNGNRRPIDKPRGWLYYVGYMRGKSVIEVFKRSKGISTIESNGILQLNRGNSNWIKGELEKDILEDESKKGVPKLRPVFRYNLYRSDEAVRASVRGDVLIIFDSDLDKHISKVNYLNEVEEAPNSLSGF